MELFNELWLVLRDYYAPTTTRAEAVKRAASAMWSLGHEVTILPKHRILVDGMVFEIGKVPGHVHFELRQLATAPQQ